VTRFTRPPHPDVTDYRGALRWLRNAWTTLPVAPVRIHARDIEDGSALGAHRFSAAFWRILNLGPYSTEEVTETDTCYHPRLVGSSIRECPDCSGDGVHQVTRLRYLSPMSAALSSLSRDVPPPPGRPSGVDVIVALAWSGWDLDIAASRLGMPIVSADHRKTVEALVLMHIRRLHSKYSAGPIARGPSWVDMSEANRSAIMDGEKASEAA
jgi:hypothetical protein